MQRKMSNIANDSVDNTRDQAQPANVVYMLTFLSCIGGFLFGYDTGIISGALVLLSDRFDLLEWEKELVVSLTVVGALASAAAGGFMIDRYGRKRTILASSVLFGVGSLVMAATPNLPMLMVGRFIVGLGVGSGSMAVPVYMSEVADTEVRGSLLTCINVAITLGQFVACLVAGAFSYVSNGWRFMLGLALLPAVVQFIGFLYMPESPRWLVENGRREEALAALKQIRGSFGEAESECLRIADARDMEPSGGIIISSSPASDSALGGHYRIFITNAPSRRALVLGCALQAAQQFGGINTIMYYSATILKVAGFSDPSEAIWLASAVSFCNLFGSCVGLYLVERSGRRPLTLYSLGAVVVALLSLSITFYAAQHQSDTADTDADYGSGKTCDSYKYCFDCVQDDDCGFCTSLISESYSGRTACISKNSDDDGPLYPALCRTDNFYGDSCPGSNTIGWVIFMGMCLYLLVFSPGMGPMPWCLNSEIYCTEARGLGNSIATTVNWSSNLIMSMTFLTLTSQLSPQGAFMLYALISLGFFLFFLLYLPETKGVPLENTMLLFQKENWGKAYLAEDEINAFLDLGDGDASGSLLRGARKIDVTEESVTGLSTVHIRETSAADIPNNNRTISSPHHNEPPEDDFMYKSITSSGAAAKLIRAARRGSDAGSSQSAGGSTDELGPRGLSVTSL